MAFTDVGIVAGVTIGTSCIYKYYDSKYFDSLFYGIVQGVTTLAIKRLFGKTPSFIYLAGLALYFVSRNTFAHQREWTNSDRKQIYIETMQFIQAGRYTSPNGTICRLKQGIDLSQKSESCTAINSAVNSKVQNTRISVVNKDCLDVAQEYTLKGHRVAILNFAAHDNPGGNSDKGTNGQEEDLCYRSELAGFMEDQRLNTLSRPKDQQLYPLEFIDHPEKEHIIHTPDVTVFRASRAQSYVLLNNPFSVGILSSAAPIHPPLNDDNTDYQRVEDKLRMKKLIQMQLTAACQKKYDTIILGAFGCGYYKNPPHGVARLYQEVITESFIGVFQNIVFAILEDLHSRSEHNSDGNLRPFQECFGKC